MKQKKSLVVILSYVAAAVFLFNGVCKIFNILPELDFLEKMNFSKPGSPDHTAAIILGIIEIAGVVGLVIASSRATVSFLLILLVVGAIGSEIGAGFQFTSVLIPSGVFVLLAAIAYYDNMIAAEEEEEEIEHRFDNVAQ